MLVRRLGQLTGTDSNATGAFTLAVTDPVELLEVAAGSTELVPSLVPVRNDGAVVHVPTATRVAYEDALGWFGTGGALDLAIAIRIAAVADDQLAVHVGGGIVADSDPAAELAETEDKAAGWRAALALLGR